MHARLTAALGIVRQICDRANPLEPLNVGTLAQAVEISTSSASRICAELEAFGLIARGEAYGAYRIGGEAVALSGQAARPHAAAVDFALTVAYQATGETVALVAATRGGARVVGVVESAWTLRVATRVGDRIAHPDSAARRALRPLVVGSSPATVMVSQSGVTSEMATPILAPSGACLAALVVRYPSRRSDHVQSKARRALLAAREQLEASIARADADLTQRLGESRDDRSDPARSVIGAAATILNLLAMPGESSVRAISARTGIRLDRTRRLVDILMLTGCALHLPESDTVRLPWAVHGWHRAIVDATLSGPAQRLVTAASDRAGTTAYLIVRRGMRSSTVAEAIVDGALNMGSWLGRPGQLVASDGGPVLLMNLNDAQIRQVFPARITMTGSGTPKNFEAFLPHVRRARSGQVVTLPDFGEDGLTSVAAPVRDAADSVIAAACIVGPTDHVSSRLTELKQLACELAADVSHLLRRTESPRPGC